MSELLVGFHSVDITPKTGGIPLAGYGGTQHRIAARVLEPLECLMTAVQQGEQTILFVNIDVCTLAGETAGIIRELLSDAVKIPEENVIVSATHTHSGPDLLSPLPSIAVYKEELRAKLPDCAIRALHDLSPAVIRFGKIEVGNRNSRLNFTRHYKMTDREYQNCPEKGPVYYVGDNFGNQYAADPGKYVYTGHVREADPMMQLLEFQREGKDSVLFCNFQAHATTTGGMNEKNLSSDFPYRLRKGIEARIKNLRAVYVQGAAGNINPFTRMKREGIIGLTWRPDNERDLISCRAYGDILAAYAYTAYKGLEESKSNTLRFSTRLLTRERDHRRDAEAEIAGKIAEIFRKEGRTKEVETLCREHGFESPYEATTVYNKSTSPTESKFRLNAIRFGDIAMVTSPFENFSETGEYVKEKSPFKMTLFQGYSCGHWYYMPSDDAPENCYEKSIMLFIPGTAEFMAENHLEMLKQLKEEK